MADKVETSSEVTNRHDAISKALADIPEFGDDFKLPGQAAPETVVEDPSGDAQTTDATSTETEPADAKAGKPPVERPAEAPTDPKIAEPAATFEAPKNWSADRRNDFAQLPPKAQKLLLDVHKEANAGFTKYAQENAAHRKTAESVSKAFEPYAHELRQAGMDEATAAQFLIREREQFNRDPIGFLAPIAARMGNGDPSLFIKALIEKTGLTQEKLFGGQQQTQTQEDPNLWVDPSVLRLQEKLQQHDQTLGQLNNFIRAEQERVQREASQREQESRFQAQREQEHLGNELSTIIGSVDGEGNLRYPHFDQVEDTIVRLLKTDPQIKDIPNTRVAEKFELAYRRAVRLHDDIHQQETEAEFAKRLAAQEKQKTVQKATAAATRKGGPGSNGTVRPGPMSSREAISKAFGDLGIL